MTKTESLALVCQLLLRVDKLRVIRWTLSLIPLYCVIAAFGQDLAKVYFDRNGEPCSPESSYYYSVIRKNRSTSSFDTVKFYYTHSNRLQAIGLRDQFGNRMGLHESFYENGNLKSKRRYEVNRNKAMDLAQDSIDCTILEFYDSLGHQMVQNGEGMVHGRLDFLLEHGKVVNGFRDSVWTVFYNNGNVYCYESWHIGHLVDGISYDPGGKEYYYLKILVLPEPILGFQEFYRQASKNLVYPKEAQRRSVEGTVLVRVMVEKDGSISSSEIARGVGFGCDEEALKAVALSPPWVPCEQRGQSINYKMIIPIVFKLK